MKLEVRLFAYLRENRGKVVQVDVRPGETTVLDVLNGLGIPVKEATLILLKGQDAGLQATFEEGDYLALFPPVGGG
ncbi:MAG: MoaD/ThiS family protein [Treponema sp.]|nr:MoaD/ThiS family protein [Treponema sp.]